MKKEGIGEKPYFLKKKTSGLAWVMGLPGLTGSLHRPVFWQTWTGPAIGSTRWADPGLITMVFGIIEIIS